MAILSTNHLAIEKQIATGGSRIRCPWCNGLNRDSGDHVSGHQSGDPMCCDRFTEAIFEIITQVDAGQAKYPARARQAAEMIELKNLMYVDTQVRELFRTASGTSREELGTALQGAVLWCPYCRSEDGRQIGNRFGNPELCCFDLGEAVAGVLTKMQMQQQMDNAARVAENADRLKECGVTVH